MWYWQKLTLFSHVNCTVFSVLFLPIVDELLTLVALELGSVCVKCETGEAILNSAHAHFESSRLRMNRGNTIHESESSSGDKMFIAATYVP